MTLQYTVRGTKEVRALLDRAGNTVRNRRALHKIAAVQIHGWIIRNFRAEGGLHKNGGLKWPPLSASRVAQRGSSRPILVDKGTLRQGWVFSVSDSSARVYNPVSYAALHEQGRGKIPQRKMLPEESQARDEIVIPAWIAFLRKKIPLD